MIEITVKTLDSRNHPFSVEDDITVKDFKDLIADKVDIPAETQRLIYCGRVLQDAKKLNEYDVNGKVVHLVQRAPPQPNRPSSGGNNFSRFHHPRHQGPSSNQIYLGSMAYSADVMDGQQGIPQLPLSSNLSRSRLNVARKMLALASAIIDQLENQDTDTSNVVDQLLDDPIDTTPLLAAQVYVPAYSNVYVEQQAALSAALSLTNNFLNNVNEGVTSETQNNNPSAQSATTTTEQNTESPNYDDVQPATAPPQPDPEQATSSTTDSEQQPAAESANPDANSSTQSNNGNIARTSCLATLIEKLGRIQTRLQPFMTRYYELMNTDPTFESDTEMEAAQRVFDRVSAAMHALGHGYHALSDVLCHFNRPAPRALLCRPTLVPQAVVQAGISLPVHVQATVDVQNVTPRNLFQRTYVNSEEGSDQSDNSTNMDQQSETNATSETTENTGTEPQAPTSEQPQGNRPHFTVTQRPGGGRNVDIIVAMNPDDDSLSQALGPNQELIQSLLHAVTNSVMRSVNLSGGVPVSMGGGTINIPVGENGSMFTQMPQSAPSAPPPTSDTTAPPTTGVPTETTSSTNNTANGATNGAGQNSQARGNTATLPTTSTQTPRATPRPHVHLSPHSFRAFDPFLQCNSHHITGRSRGNRQNREEAATNNTELLSQLQNIPFALNRLVRERAAAHVQTSVSAPSSPSVTTSSSRAETPVANRRERSVEDSRVQGSSSTTETDVTPNAEGPKAAPRSTSSSNSGQVPPNNASNINIQSLGGTPNFIQSLLQMSRAMRGDAGSRNQTSTSTENNRPNSQTPVSTATTREPAINILDPLGVISNQDVANIPDLTSNEGTLRENRFLTQIRSHIAASLGQNLPETNVNSSSTDTTTSSNPSVSNKRNMLSESSGNNMEVDTFYDAPELDDGQESAASCQKVLLPSTNGEAPVPPVLPDVNIGSEFWHNNVPSEWVSVVTRDVQIQRHDHTTNQQIPYSDAYLSTVPAKRRKLISCNKPQGSLPQVITESLRQAVLTSGLGSVAPIELVANAAGGDSSIQSAYREELRQSIRSRPAHATPGAGGVAPIKRFPNASFSFQKP